VSEGERMELAIKNPIALTTQNFLTPKPKVKSLRVFSVKCTASLSSLDGAATGQPLSFLTYLLPF
jgi:carbamoyl-phosphate synthase small subunit